MKINYQKNKQIQMHSQLQRNKWKSIETGYRSLQKKREKKEYIKNKIKEGKMGEKPVASKQYINRNWVTPTYVIRACS